MKKIVKETFKGKTNIELVDFLENKTGLSKSLIKKNMTFGGCWLRKKGKKPLNRMRRAKYLLTAGDHVEFYYDSTILTDQTFTAQSLYETNRFGIWVKPPGMLTQGTKYGDGTSLLRFLEKEGKKPLLVHRLDRETAGLVVIANDGGAASKLSQMFRENAVEKYYRAEVLGTPEKEEDTLTFPLEDKEAKTFYRVISKSGSTSMLDIQIFTGRTHQIRKHLDMIGHPVMGDPRYGEGNKNSEGLKLIAYRLKFKDPFTNKMVDVTYEP